MASHTKRSFIWNDQKQTLNPGQLLTGRKVLAKNTGISESKVYRILKYLESEQQIEQQTTNNFTVITIKNWGEYQKVNSKMNNQRTTSEQPVNTYNNDNNDNKDNKYVSGIEKERMKTLEVIKSKSSSLDKKHYEY
jgi:DNA-binding transcriptional regulator YhcF (GntR family)